MSPRVARVALGLLVLAACKREQTAANDAAASAASTTAAPVVVAGGQLVTGIAPSDYGPSLVSDTGHIPPTVESNGPVTIVGSEVIPGTKAPPADPFVPVMSAVEASAVGCFAGQPPGEYAAVIAVHVTPTGTASRVEVEGVTDPAVVACLAQAGGVKWPTSKDGRKVRVPVYVKG